MYDRWSEAARKLAQRRRETRLELVRPYDDRSSWRDRGRRRSSCSQRCPTSTPLVRLRQQGIIAQASDRRTAEDASARHPAKIVETIEHGRRRRDTAQIHSLRSSA